MGIDIPGTPTRGVPPRRASSMREIRVPPAPSSCRQLVFPGGVAQGGVVPSNRGQDQGNNKIRRSSSFNYQSHSQGVTTPTRGSRGMEDTTQSPARQYPLRETVSLSQLQGGGSGQQRGVAMAAGFGSAAGANDGGHMPLKSSSMQNLHKSRSSKVGPRDLP